MQLIICSCSLMAENLAYQQVAENTLSLVKANVLFKYRCSADLQRLGSEKKHLDLKVIIN